MLRFQSNLEKKIQAASVVLRGQGHMDRMRLLKILYIADRESLAERGTPIVGGRAVAMDHGPLHSDIYSFIRGEHELEATWSKFIQNEGHHTLFLVEDPGRSLLSPYEIEKLEEVTSRYHKKGTWDLSELTHDFPEWKKAHHKGTSTTIPVETILAALDFDQEEISAIIAEADAHSRLVRAFGG